MQLLTYLFKVPSVTKLKYRYHNFEPNANPNDRVRMDWGTFNGLSDEDLGCSDRPIAN